MSQAEKESLGFYVKHHPLGQHSAALRHFATATTADLAQMPDQAEVVLGGVIKQVRPIITKTGRNAGSKMAVFEIEDLAGSATCVIFPRDYAQFQDLVQADRVVFVRGQVDRTREEPQVKTSEVLDLEEGRRQLSKAVVIRLHAASLTDERLMALREVLAAHPGPLPLYLDLENPGAGRTLIRAGDTFKVSMDPALHHDL